MTRTPRRRARRGRLVAIEGIDGAGKSTLLEALGRALRRRGRTVKLRREPTDPTIGRLAQEAGARDPWTGAVYFTVDRHLAAPELREQLRRYDVVLSDRSFYSTLAYQGSRLASAERRRLEELQLRATIAPDRVVLLDLPISWLRRRLVERPGRRGPLERYRSLAAVARAYRRLARRHGWTVLDARGTRAELLRGAIRAVDGRPRRAGPTARGKKLRVSRGPGRVA